MGRDGELLLNHARRASQTALAISALALVIAILAPAACSSQRPSDAADPSRLQPLSDLDARTIARHQDLNTLREGLIDKHADPFFHTPRRDFVAAADTLESRASDLDDDAWIVELARLTAMIGDAHTRLVLVAGKPPCQTSLPIRFVALADGLFIDAAPNDHLDLLGARVIAINNTPIDEVARRVRTFMASETDADARLVAAVFLKYDHVLHALGLLDAPGKVTLSVVGAGPAPGGEAPSPTTPRHATLDSIPDESPWAGAVLPDPRTSQLPIGRVSRAESYWHQYLADVRVMYCRYDRCADMPGKSVSAWAREVMTDVETHNPRAIAIDLRRNAGGNSGLLHPLIDRLRAWKRQDASRRVYAIVGPMTFSSGVTNALDLRTYADAAIAGEEPGQAIGNFGEVRKLHLPRCGFDVSYATTRRDNPKSPVPVTIDVPAPMTSEAYFAGRDPAVEAVSAHP